MGHPLIDEFCRQAGDLRPDFYRRCQRVFRDEVQPALDELDTVKAEIARLQQEIARLQQEIARLQIRKRESKAVGA